MGPNSRTGLSVFTWYVLSYTLLLTVYERGRVQFLIDERSVTFLIDQNRVLFFSKPTFLQQP